MTYCKIFATNITDKETMAKIHRKSYKSIRKRQKAPKKSGQNILADNLQEG